MKCGTAEELAKVREFYIELLGLKVIREWAEGMMIDTGNGLLEIFTNADGTHCLGAIRHMVLLTDDGRIFKGKLIGDIAVMSCF